ncbi:MAG TPA: ABC-F family ATP-binding cassette domain-containing protein [Candidatus Hydrogenedentes bacterium]|nr:ABC-F family ATP-binding cassette domain-containing protein [Candidatus Hydrogenedentota bacterium]
MREGIVARPLLSAESVRKAYGAQEVLGGVSLTIHEGDRVGLIGRNGSGKSTLLRLLYGDETPDAGKIVRARGIRVGFLRQQCPLNPEWTVQQALEAAVADLRSLEEEYRDTLASLAETPGECWAYQELQQRAHELESQLSARDGWRVEPLLKTFSTALRLPAPERKLGELSGGELRRVDLAVQLAGRPDVLLLDEPTNHIDTESSAWIESWLESYSGACVLVTHDRYFLDRVASRIVELEFGRTYSFPGGYSRFLEYKSAVEDTQIRSEANRLALIRRELAWYRRGAKARTTKQKARIQRLESLVEEGPPPAHKEYAFAIPEPERLGKDVIEARGVGHGWGDQWLFRHFSFRVENGMRVGIVGPNGSGKTTLLRILMGTEVPREGEVLIGSSVRFLYVDQQLEEVDPAQPILDFVSGGAKFFDVGARRLHVPSYLEQFLFERRSVDMPMGNLSGGECARICLAKKLMRGGNLLVLDEPTNDLDLYALRLLEETLLSFEGAALVVSHDRYFLNRVCTHILSLGDSETIGIVTGNYDDYLLWRERRPSVVSVKDASSETALSGRGVTRDSDEKKESREIGRKKLTWAEQRELEQIPELIEQRERELADLEGIIGQENFYTRDYREVQETLARMDQLRESIAHLYERWTELEARRG